MQLYSFQKLEFTPHWISQNSLFISNDLTKVEIHPSLNFTEQFIHFKWNVVWNSQGAAITTKLDSTIESNFLPYWKLSATSGNYKPLWNTAYQQEVFCENLVQWQLKKLFKTIQATFLNWFALRIVKKNCLDQNSLKSRSLKYFATSSSV